MVINRREDLKESFEEILNRLDIWINESPAWTIQVLTKFSLSPP